MKNQIPVLKVTDVAGCESEIIRSFAERLYLLFSDNTAVLVSAAATPEPGAAVALAMSDGEVHLGVYHPDGHGIRVENLFAAEKHFFYPAARFFQEVFLPLLPPVPGTTGQS